MCKHMHRGPFASGRGMQRGSHLQHDELCKEAATYIRARYAKRQPFTARRGMQRQPFTAWRGMQRQPFTSGRGIQRGITIYCRAKFVNAANEKDERERYIK